MRWPMTATGTSSSMGACSCLLHPNPTTPIRPDQLGDLLKAATPAHLRTWTTQAGIEIKANVTCFIPDIRRYGRRPGTTLSPTDVLLVVELLSPGTRRRDFNLKRREYAAAGIPDYWIVDGKRRRLTVFSLM